MTKTPLVEPLSVLRVVLHVAVVLLLILRSSQLSSALHPFQRTIANNWVRLLFYVDTSKKIGEDEENAAAAAKGDVELTPAEAESFQRSLFVKRMFMIQKV